MAGDRTTSFWSRILGGSVNDLKTTFRDAIAVESAMVHVEAIRWPPDAQGSTKSTDGSAS